MSKLTFPTQAEQAVERFRNSKVTISLVTICAEMAATRQVYYRFGRRHIEYYFDDDSSLVITGQGKNHKVETFLP